MSTTKTQATKQCPHCSATHECSAPPDTKESLMELRKKIALNQVRNFLINQGNDDEFDIECAQSLVPAVVEWLKEVGIDHMVVRFGEGIRITLAEPPSKLVK